MPRRWKDSPSRRRTLQGAWWCGVLVVAAAGALLIRSGQPGLGWAALLAALALAFTRVP